MEDREKDIERELLLNGKAVKYVLQKKKVKNVNIRVKSDRTVFVSAPSRVTVKAIEDILRQKSDFILNALRKYEERGTDEPKTYATGESFWIFGEPMALSVTMGNKNQASLSGDRILLTVKDPNDAELKKKTLTKLFDGLCRERVLSLCQKAYPRFAPFGIAFPAVKFRHMKSRWGSCQYKKGVLTFNLHLIHAPADCVEFVVYHEFTHFLHPDHSAAFYKTLATFVPDHKERKKRLEATPRK